MTGSILQPDCYGNQGCSIRAAPNSDSYGTDFNDNNGGVYVAEWTSDGINVWFFSRDNIPDDISGDPDPSTWGLPVAKFEGQGCDWNSHFRDLQIVSVIYYMCPLSSTNLPHIGL